MFGVQTLFDKEMFKRYMRKPIEEQKAKVKRNYKKIDIEDKQNLSYLLNLNLSIINLNPKNIGSIFYYDPDLIPERDIYIRLMNKPLHLKDNEFI